MTFTAGTQLYKFILQSRIGGGNFGEVWLAKDQTLNAEVAIKILDGSMASVAAILNEAHVGNKLNHQNVLKVHYADVVNYSGADYVIIAMDHLPKGSVLNILNPSNFIILPKAISITIDILRGLEYLHEQNLFHNDIKPSNILLGTQNEGRLTDYGISCTSPGLVPTAAPNAYILHRAPETTASNNISVATDIYQVGLTMFRLINGIGLVDDVLSKVGIAEFERLKTLGKVPADSDFQPFVINSLKKIINKATNPIPSDRYQSALEMRRALERLNIFGFWDADSKGELFGILNNYKYSFFITKASNGFSMECFKENLSSGIKRRISGSSCKGVTEIQMLKAKKLFIQSVVQGEQ